MVEAVEKAGVPNMVSFNYRRVPAVTLAKELIDEGRLGRIFHYRANFLQDWTISPDVPQGGTATWRLDVKAAGSGVTGDLLAHCIDTAIWLNGSIATVCAMTETFVKERKHVETGKVEPVGIDDACAFLCRFDNGSLGNFEVHPLRARAQGALHVRDQRRERLDRAGTCTTCTGSSTSITATRASCAAGARSTSPTRASIRTWTTGGCPACRSVMRNLRPPDRRLPFCDGQGGALQPYFP